MSGIKNSGIQVKSIVIKCWAWASEWFPRFNQALLVRYANWIVISGLSLSVERIAIVLQACCNVAV